MVRLLLHSDDAVYDDATKKYTFTLDRRLDKPVALRVVKAHYSAVTAASYPLVVYLRSNALSSLIKDKHTLRLQNTNHEATENILGSLTETHAVGRFNLERDGRRFKSDPHRHVREIDIFFSDNATLIDGGNTTGTPASTTVSDQDILDITNLIFFLDWDHAASLDPNPISQNEDITSITSRLSPNNYVFATTGAGIVYSSFGETNSMLSTVNYKYALDSTTAGNVDEGNTACLTMMFRTKDVLASWAWLFKSPLFQITAGEPLDSISNMGYYDADSSLWGYTSLVIEGGKDYLLQIKKSSNTFSWLLRDLATGTEQTEDTTDTAATGTANQPFYLSNAQSGFQGLKISHVIEFLSVDEDDCDAVKTWMLQKYTGEDVEEEALDTSANASWFLELDIEQ